MKYKIKRRKKAFKTWYILLILLIIIILMSTSYSLWQTNLYINGTIVGEYLEPELPIEIVKPDNNSDRLSTNTSFEVSGLFTNFDIFTVDKDVQEGNTVTTQIVNANKADGILGIISSRTVNVTISFTIQNNSEYTFTDGMLEGDNNVYMEEDSGNLITPQSASLSTTTVRSGESVTLTAQITFNTKQDTPVGSYVSYKISFLCNGAKRYYNYKILVTG